nr:MAG TPA: hypothetical protein [Caudoviricetes sp.]
MKFHHSPGENGWYDSHVSNQTHHPFPRPMILFGRDTRRG